VAKTGVALFTARDATNPMKKLNVGIVGYGWAAEANMKL
jgi:hypothetical protein